MKRLLQGPIDQPDDVRPLVEAICDRLDPDAIWLFGSRARGDHGPDSDWDLLVALPDTAPAEAYDPVLSWQIQRDVGIPATIVTADSRGLAESWNAANTLAYVVAREGKLLHVRS